MTRRFSLVPLVLLCTALLVGCAPTRNLFGEHYSGATLAQLRDDAGYVAEEEVVVKILPKGGFSAAVSEMFAQCYSPVGKANWEGLEGEGDEAAAREQAKKIGASRVLLRVDKHEGSFERDLDLLTNWGYFGVSSTYDPGHFNSGYLPLSGDTYEYHALFFAKFTPESIGGELGLVVTKPSAESLIKQGAFVYAVVQGSKADEEGLQPGDILLAINDKPVRCESHNLEAFTTDSLEKEDVNVLTFSRKGKTIEQYFYMGEPPALPRVADPDAPVEPEDLPQERDLPDPAETSAQAQTTEPATPAETPAQTQATEPATPVEAPAQTQAAEPAKPVEAPAQTQAAEPATPTAEAPAQPQAAEPAKPAEAPAQPQATEPATPAEVPVQPQATEPAKPAEAPVQTQAAEPATPAEVAAQPQAAEPATPAEAPAQPQATEPTSPAEAPAQPQATEPATPAEAPAQPQTAEPATPVEAPAQPQAAEPAKPAEAPTQTQAAEPAKQVEAPAQPQAAEPATPAE